MANNQRTRFVSPNETNIPIPRRHATNANLPSPYPASVLPPSEYSEESSPPASPLASAQFDQPTVTKEPVLATLNAPSPTAAKSLTEALVKQPPKAQEPSWGLASGPSMVHHVLRFLEGRQYAVPEAVLRNASSSTTVHVEETQRPMQPINIPGTKPFWEDELDEEFYRSSIAPASFASNNGNTVIEPDVYTPEVVQRGFNIPRRTTGASKKN